MDYKQWHWTYKEDEYLCTRRKHMFSRTQNVNGNQRVKCIKLAELDYYKYTDCVHTLTSPARKECEYYEGIDEEG